MKLITFVTTALVVCSVSACTKKASTEQVFGQTEATLVRTRSQAVAAAFNKKSLDELMAFFPGDSILMPPQAPTMRGKDAIRGFFDHLYSEGATELVVETQDVGGHGPLAYETGVYSMNRRPASGASTRDRGKYVFVWRNHGSQWMIDYTIWSSDLPERIEIASR